MINKKITLLVTVILFLLFANLTVAQSDVEGGDIKFVGNSVWDRISAGQGLHVCFIKESPGCTLQDGLEILYLIASLILGIVGSLALLMFVYGGVTYITAAGNDEKIKRGTEILRNASIGIIIVLLAWSLVNFTILAFTGRPLGGVGKFFPDDNSIQFNQPVP